MQTKSGTSNNFMPSCGAGGKPFITMTHFMQPRGHSRRPRGTGGKAVATGSSSTPLILRVDGTDQLCHVDRQIYGNFAQDEASPSSIVAGELETVITRRGFEAITLDDGAYADLLCLEEQCFDDTVIISTDGETRDRSQYRGCFEFVRQRLGAAESRGLCSSNDAHSGRIMGFVAYRLYRDPLCTTPEVVFFFYNAQARGVSLVVAPSMAHNKEAEQIMCNLGRVQSFGRYCSWCGDWRRKHMCCPCLGVKYCGKECQTKHWRQHRTQCPKSKGYMDAEVS